QPNAVGYGVVDAGLEPWRLKAPQVLAHANDELRCCAEGYVGDRIGYEAPESHPVKRDAVLQHGGANAAFAAREVFGPQIRIGERLHVANPEATIEFVQRGSAKRAISGSIEYGMFTGAIGSRQPGTEGVLPAVRVTSVS